jgi:hypothetical protein
VEREIDPLLAESAQRDLQAAERALATLHAHFQIFHAGIEPFVDEVGGWGTRFGVLGRTIGDGWNQYVRGRPDPGAVRGYIEEKFHRNVIAEDRLQAAVEDTLVQFQEELVANRNVMLTQVQTRLAASDTPVELRGMNVEELKERFARRSARLLQDMGGDSLANGVASFAGGVVAEEVARRIAIQVIARVATQMASTAAVSSAAAGSATAGGAAAGGAGGSAVGPVGTVVGVGIGIAVGVAVDWWMSERFEAKLSAQCHAFLDHVERELIEGSPPSDSGDAAPGMREVFEESIRQTQSRQRDALLASLMENGS